MTTRRNLIDGIIWIGHLIAFGSRAIPAAARALARPSWWLRPFHGMVVGAMPLALVAGVAMGVVIWLDTRNVLRGPARAR